MAFKPHFAVRAKEYRKTAYKPYKGPLRPSGDLTR